MVDDNVIAKKHIPQNSFYKLNDSSCDAKTIDLTSSLMFSGGFLQNEVRCALSTIHVRLFDITSLIKYCIVSKSLIINQSIIVVNINNNHQIVMFNVL